MKNHLCTIVFILFTLASFAQEKSEAKELLKKIIYLDPKSLEAYLNLGEIYSEEKDSKRSQKMYKIAHEILQELPQDAPINYRGKTKVNVLLTFIKSKL